MKKKRLDPKKLLAKYRKQQVKKKPEGNPDGQVFSEFAFVKAMAFARQSYAALFVLVTVIDHKWQLGGLNKYLWDNKAFVGAYLSRNQGFGAVLRQAYEKYQPELIRDDLLDDPTALLDFSTLINFLSDHISEALPSPLHFPRLCIRESR
jgi:hypothetical protein